MGLDMYLYADRFIHNYEFQPDPRFDQIASLVGLDKATAPDTPHMHVKVCVAYWRKANAIHNWFVQNVQDGEDKCRPHHVEREHLEELRRVAQEALDAFNLGDKERVMTLLPPTRGFFFGSTSIDEWFAEDLKSTIEQIDRALTIIDPEELISFEYQSSW